MRRTGFAQASLEEVREKQAEKRNLAFAAPVSPLKRGVANPSGRGRKASQGLKARKGARLRAGRKTKAWAAERARLKPRFAAARITSCEFAYEGCWRDDALGFAHDAKRRKQPDLSVVALACNSCHDKLELMGPEQMFAEVHRVIDARAVQP